MALDRQLTGHVIVGGYGHLGTRIVAQLRERGWQVVAIEKSPDSAGRKRADAIGCRLIEGDICDDDLFEQAGVRTAARVIIATGDDRANLEAAITVRQMNRDVTLVVRLFDQALARRLEGELNLNALSASFLASPAFVAAATDDAIVALFNVGASHLSLYQGEFSAGCLPRKGVVALRKSGQCLTPCVADGESSGRLLFAAIHPAETSSPFVQRRRAKHTGILHGIRQLHPGHLFTELRLMWRHAAAITRSLLVSLIAMLVLSVLVFSIFGGLHPLDALYFVVTTMTTVGYGDINLLNASTGLKIYGVLMMLCGATLLATVYALIADYVLTARVEYLLGRREMHVWDHTVVVGLGHVGYRVARDLKLLGVEVVAIEANDDSDNVNAARHHFPVIIGNAARSSILEKAAVTRAQTIIAATDDPMLNLSIALRARESNPQIKTVVRTYEIGLAEKFKTFNLDQVLSTSAIAAPAFVDAALYPGVEGSFRLDGEDVLVANHRLTADSLLCGKTAGVIGAAFGIAAIAIADGDEFHLLPSDTVLQEDDRVILLLAREKMVEWRGGRVEEMA
ncbi:MAG: potassium channel family protein [Armatimonadota bacterium]